jgi:ribosomal protein S18 acetylase RimI-like enzyme
MKKILLLILCNFNITSLFCAESHFTTATFKALYAAAGPGEPFSYEITPPNLITLAEASQHAALINSISEINTLENQTNIEPETCVQEFRKRRDILISAYQKTSSPNEQILVGNIFGTKHRNQDKVIIQINGINVAADVQGQGIGTHLLHLFKGHTRNLPIALYVKKSNTRALSFWDHQSGFEKASVWLGWGLLRSDDPSTPLEREDIVTYYSKNNSGEELFVDSSDEETL